MNVFRTMMDRFATPEPALEAQPPEPVKEAEPVTLFTLYALPEEIANVRDRYVAIGIAEAELLRIEEAIQLAERQVDEQQRRQRVDYLRAAAVALGEASPEPAADIGTSLSQTRNQLQGLKMRDAEAKAKLGDCKGAFRTAVVQLIGRCAERCAEDYVKATKEQAWCHLQMEVAQNLVGEARRIVDALTWARYLVPGSPHIPAIHRQSREEKLGPVLMSADRLTLGQDAALKDLGKSGRKLFGGWPL